MSTDDCELTTYAEMADVVSNLAFLVRERRRERRLSQRAAATEMGLNGSTLHRLEHGGDVATASLVAILGWLDWTHPNSRKALAREFLAEEAPCPSSPST